jgi:hypothetical protein
MGEFLTVVAVAAGYGVVMYGLIRFARWARRRGIGGGLMSPIDQNFHPIAHEAREELRGQEERVAPTTSPDPKDPDGR